MIKTSYIYPYRHLRDRLISRALGKRKINIAMVVLYFVFEVMLYMTKGQFGVAGVYDLIIYPCLIGFAAYPVVDAYLRAKKLNGRMKVNINFDTDHLDVEMGEEGRMLSSTRPYRKLKIGLIGTDLKIMGRNFCIVVPEDTLTDKQRVEIIRRFAHAYGRKTLDK